MLKRIGNLFEEIEEGNKFSALIMGLIVSCLLGAIISAILAGVFFILPGDSSFIDLLIDIFFLFGGIAPAFVIVLFTTHGNDPFEYSAVVIYYLSVFVTNWLGGSYPWSFLTMLIIGGIYGLILDSIAKRREEERELNFLKYENKVLKEKLEEYEKN